MHYIILNNKLNFSVKDTTVCAVNHVCCDHYLVFIKICVITIWKGSNVGKKTHEIEIFKIHT